MTRMKIDWREFLKPSRKKIVLFIIIGIIITVLPFGKIIVNEVGPRCVSGATFGYCITYHGFPFQTFITGEVSNVPGDHLKNIIIGGIIGFLCNLSLLYLILSTVYY